MRIIVPIKQVPETSAVKMDERTGTMIREGVEAIVNPLDLYAIEAAIQIKESRQAEVVVLSMGPPKAAAAIREAIAMGCDRGVLLSDKAFAGSDTWATSYTLAAAIRRIGPPELIICGERATDGDTGQVGPGLAAFLGLPVATYVSKIDQIRDGLCRVHRMVEDGYEILETDTPAVITVVKEIAPPRLPTLRGKLRARQARIPTWTGRQLDVEAGKLGLDGSPTRVVKISRPKLARKCQKIVARDPQSLSEAVDKLVLFLQERRVI